MYIQVSLEFSLDNLTVDKLKKLRLSELEQLGKGDQREGVVGAG